LAAGTAKVMFAEGLALPAGLITAAVLGRALGPADYGVFAAATSLVLTLEWVPRSLFSRTTAKLIGDDEHGRPVGVMVLRWHIGIGLALGIGMYLLAHPIAAMLGDLSAVPFVRLFALQPPLACGAAACRQILSGRRAYNARAIASAARWISRPLFIIVLVYSGLSLVGAALGSVLAAASGFAVAQALARVPLSAPTLVSARRLWGLALPVFALALSLRLIDRIGLFALTALGGPAEAAGWYGAALAFSAGPSMFTVGFAPLLLTAVASAQATGDVQSAMRMATQSLRLVVGCLPFAAIGAGSAKQLIAIVFGPGFEPAAALVWPLLLSALAMMLISVASALLTAGNRAHEASMWIWPLLPITLAASVFVVPRFGATGAALVTAGAAVTGACALLVLLSASLNVRTDIRTWLRCGAVATGTGLLAAVWPTPGAWLLFKVAALGVGAVAALAALGEFSADDRRILRKLVQVADS
jgi:O-antigen/teichoic acid export membrane protein